ncbi:hypothetical protein T265_03726 [Opisthorchis viverrini]|uniref:Uncharacterized protein n=1 Tax=Opisthorchis viverrini TaxID=6198 RepID=A0A075AHD8_OPIVI|nr:hypothetical protein T265_03726 [Opisthorchis viverrini]KER29709.1 hypothetical protein T265_03726 [Opisthorchis viverrini]
MKHPWSMQTLIGDFTTFLPRFDMPCAKSTKYNRRLNVAGAKSIPVPPKRLYCLVSEGSPKDVWRRRRWESWLSAAALRIGRHLKLKETINPCGYRGETFEPACCIYVCVRPGFVSLAKPDLKRNGIIKQSAARSICLSVSDYYQPMNLQPVKHCSEQEDFTVTGL